MSERERTLESAISELRRLFDRLTSIYESLKIKVLGFIAGELAITPFIFSGKPFFLDNVTIIIFFAIGMALYAISFAFLLWAIATASWDIPMNIEESQKLDTRYKRRIDFLIYLREDYESSIVLALRRIKVRARIFNLALLLLVVGLVMLFVIKYTYGGTN